MHQQIRSCAGCPLHQQRTQAVPGEGSPKARVMFVGEGPGFHEDRQGKPFVGPAGKFLNELLASVGLQRQDVFITNMVKCRPPNNRDPFHGEITSCSHYLEEQIALIQPQVVIPLGQHALVKWFPNESISKVRARPRQVGGLTVFPLYHPAAALHNPALRESIERDFQAIAQLLEQLPDALAQPEGKPASQQQGQQLSIL